MKNGTRTNGPASCKLRYSAIVEPAKRGKLREIIDMHTPEGSRGNGYASALLTQICQDADAEGIKLMVTVDPYEPGLSAKHLAQWYHRRGFEVLQDEPLVMLR